MHIFKHQIQKEHSKCPIDEELCHFLPMVRDFTRFSYKGADFTLMLAQIQQISVKIFDKARFYIANISEPYLFDKIYGN